MAERYPPGRHQIYYRSSLFQEGLNVSMRMLNPNGVWGEEIQLRDVGNGLYKFEIFFNQIGTWVGLFFENGVRKVSQNFLVVRERAMNSGHNILNR